MTAWTVCGLALIAVSWLWAIGTCLHLWWIDRAERKWRDWFDGLPDDRKLEGARLLLDAVRDGMPLTAAQYEAVRSSTPIHDRLAVETFRRQLDEGWPL